MEVRIGNDKDNNTLSKTHNVRKNLMSIHRTVVLNGSGRNTVYDHHVPCYGSSTTFFRWSHRFQAVRYSDDSNRCDIH